MGVPSFFKWVLKRYPKVVADAAEEKANGAATTSEPAAQAHPPAVAPTGPIPPPLEDNPLIDNLYLDMNGIIHPCCHPEEGGSFTEEEMVHRVWLYVSRVVAMVRPQRTIIMAVDGVAPRAKLNQQRSRRFRSAREAAQKAEVRGRLAAEWKARGFKLPANFADANKEEWDANVITPGTPFMAKVSSALHYHIERALQFDPAWRHLTVIFSDDTVPGEGEHKIINWIRLYGMDADLIMLGLATHERFVYIIRESLGDTTSTAHVKCGICGERGHYTDQCQGKKWQKQTTVNGDTVAPPPPPPTVAAAAAAAASGASSSSSTAASTAAAAAVDSVLIPETIASGTSFQFVLLPVLREYLARDLALPAGALERLTFPYHFEATLDDFILLCMFVGNDFLPHLPSLEIREGAIEMMLRMYKDLLPTLDGYLTTRGIVSLERLALLLKPLGMKENQIFQSRRAKEEHMRRKDRDHKERIHRVRRENAVRERLLNKTGNFAYDAPEKMDEQERQRKSDLQAKDAAAAASVERKSAAAAAAKQQQQQAAAVAAAAPVPAPLPTPPATSGFIHPSRQAGNQSQTGYSATATTAAVAAAAATGMQVSPSTPASTIAIAASSSVPASSAPMSTSTVVSASTAPVPIPAPKANLSAAALLRQKLKKGESMASTPTTTTATTPAASASGAVAMDLSTTPAPTTPPAAGPSPLARLVTSDPIPCATAAMSGLSTDTIATTATSADMMTEDERAQTRAGQIGAGGLGSMLGKRKDAPLKAEVTTTVVVGGGGVDANAMDTSCSSTDQSAAGGGGGGEGSAQDFEVSHIALSTSPPLELPLKKSKTNESQPDNSLHGAPAPIAVATTLGTEAAAATASQLDGAMSPSSPSSSSSSSSSSSDDDSPSPSPDVPQLAFDPLEEDSYGNLVSSLDFDAYFVNKWETLNAPPPNDADDPVRFGVDGWKQRYYRAKLDFDFEQARADPISTDARQAHRLFRAYIEGLCWVMHYYYQGAPSWSWYYPFHYAPLCEDLATFLGEGNLKRGIEWDQGAPFQPVAQLMAVLPSRSRHCVPRAVQPLMTSAASSPLADFYPDTFEMDLNGKRFMWQAIALLPFIDERRLMAELSKVTETFTPEEQQRNRPGREYVFANARLPVGRQMLEQVYHQPQLEDQQQASASPSSDLSALRRMPLSAIESTPGVSIDPSRAQGFSGTLRPYPDASVPGLPSVHFAPGQQTPTAKVEVVSAVYRLPSPSKAHVCALLAGAQPFERTLREEDFRTLTDKREYVQRNNQHHHHHHHHQQRGGGPQQQQQQQQQPGWQPPRGGPLPTSGGGGVVADFPPGHSYFLAPSNAPAHLAGHALNPLFYPRHQPLPSAPLQPGGVYPNGRPVGPMFNQQMYAQQQQQFAMAPPQQQQPMAYYPPPPPQQQQHQAYPYPPQGLLPYQPPYAMPMSLPMPPPPYGYPMPPPPPPSVQAFLSAPPPPGKPLGWVPPPVQQFMPANQPPRQ